MFGIRTGNEGWWAQPTLQFQDHGEWVVGVDGGESAEDEDAAGLGGEDFVASVAEGVDDPAEVLADGDRLAQLDGGLEVAVGWGGIAALHVAGVGTRVFDNELHV